MCRPARGRRGRASPRALARCAGPFARPRLCTSKGRGMKTDIHPEYVTGPRPLHLRQRVRDALHQARHQGRDLQQLPPVLHGQAEAGGLRRPRRALPAQAGPQPARVGRTPPGRPGDIAVSTDVRPLVEQIARTRDELADALGDPELPSDRAALRGRQPSAGRTSPRRSSWPPSGEDAAGPRGRGRGAARRGRRRRRACARCEEARAELAELGPRIREAMIEPDPDDDRNTHRRDPRRRRRRGGRPVRARPGGDLHPLRRVAGPRRRADGGQRGRRRRPARGDPRA